MCKVVNVQMIYEKSSARSSSFTNGSIIEGDWAAGALTHTDGTFVQSWCTK